MEIEKISIDKIKMYKNNAKEHPDWQIEQIKNSIQEFGYISPVVVDEENMILAGHGRIIALKELGFVKIPVVRKKGLSEEQKRAFIIADNQLTINTGFDMEILKTEIEELEKVDFDLSLLGFDEVELQDIIDEEDDCTQEHEESKYTKKVQVLAYTITGEKPELEDLFNDEKTNSLIKEINSLNIDEKN